MFTGFSGHGNSIHNIISLLKKENVQIEKYLIKNSFMLCYFSASARNVYTYIYEIYLYLWNILIFIKYTYIYEICRHVYNSLYNSVCTILPYHF